MLKKLLILAILIFFLKKIGRVLNIIILSLSKKIKISELFFYTMYISFLITGLTSFKIFSLNLTSWDSLFFLWILYLLAKGKIVIVKKDFLIFRIYILFIFYALIEIPNSILHGIEDIYLLKSITLVFQLIRDFLIFFLAYYFIQIVDLKRLSKNLFYIGGIYSTLMILIYFYTFLSGNKLFHAEIYEVSQWNTIRFQGFSSDPNFMGILLLLPLNIGLYYWKNFRDLFFIFSIIFVILLTLSRSVLGSVIISLLFFLLYPPYMKKIFMKIFILSTILVGIIAVSNLKFSFETYSLWESYALRLFETGSSGRDILWNTLLSKFLESPIFGFGLRYTQEVLHRYSHNSYLDLLVEYGVIGFIIFGVICGFILYKGFSNRNPLSAPYLSTFIALIFFMFFFSFLYQPYIWFIGGIILGINNRRKYEVFINNNNL